ncbi:hypothetical protein WCQ02_31350 [Paraburkholderia tropica]|uniref:hypothetical protein n=1 Tax=Paraburkholderia tropica TaxID=92647 RepID=UPI0030167FE0
MSYTNVYAVWPGERHEEIAELGNGNLSAPFVWSEMFCRYCDVRDSRFPKSEYMFRNEELWPLWKRMDIPKQLRAVLLMTYDNAYVAREFYARAAADIREFIVDFGLPEHTHWPRIAAIFESNPDCPAIGFRWTSVCEDPFNGEWNEEIEDYDQPDWSKKW